MSRAEGETPRAQAVLSAETGERDLVSPLRWPQPSSHGGSGLFVDRGLLGVGGVRLRTM